MNFSTLLKFALAFFVVALIAAFFGFGGSKGSFFGDLKAHGREAYDFFTDRKVVISRW